MIYNVWSKSLLIGNLSLSVLLLRMLIEQKDALVGQITQ